MQLPQDPNPAPLLASPAETASPPEGCVQGTSGTGQRKTRCREHVAVTVDDHRLWPLTPARHCPAWRLVLPGAACLPQEPLPSHFLKDSSAHTCTWPLAAAPRFARAASARAARSVPRRRGAPATAAAAKRAARSRRLQGRASVRRRGGACVGSACRKGCRPHGRAWVGGKRREALRVHMPRLRSCLQQPALNACSPVAAAQTCPQRQGRLRRQGCPCLGCSASSARPPVERGLPRSLPLGLLAGIRLQRQVVLHQACSVRQQ